MLVSPSFWSRALCAFRAVPFGALLVGCGAPLADEPASEPVAQESEPVTYYFDDLTYAYDYDSYARVEVGVRICETEGASSSQVVDCMAPPGYALVGGGARTAIMDGQGALLTESRALDDYFWRVRSSDVVGLSNHRLKVFAVGIRLIGVNVQTLRGLLGSYVFSNGGSFTASHSFPNVLPFQGGFRLDEGRFIRETRGFGGTGWLVTGADYPDDLPTGITLSAFQMARGYIEGFGALELQQVQSESQFHQGSTHGNVTLGARGGWVLIGYGAQVSQTSGPGRFLYGYGPSSGDARVTHAWSRTFDGSSGFTTAHGLEARRVLSTHGVCSTGTKLDAALDPCVAKVCAVRPSCCSTSWTSACVSEFESQCNKDCSPHMCSIPSFQPSWWSTNSPKTNCYGYAINNPDGHRPGASAWAEGSISVAGTTEALKADGLIPVSRSSTTCPDNRVKLALLIKPTANPDYHFLRLDSNGYWSHKFSSSAPRDTDNSVPPRRITDPETAVITGYTQFGGYFCACSDSQQGEGHTPGGRPGPEPPGGFDNPQLF